MKKTALILCLALLISMTACADNNNATPGTGTNQTDTNKNAGNNNNTGTNGTDTTGNNAIGNNGGNGAGDVLTGTARGYGGDVTVTVTVDGDDITSVEAVGENETQGVGSKAIEELPERITDADSTDVEGVSGATITSNAIKEAVGKALEGKK